MFEEIFEELRDEDDYDTVIKTCPRCECVTEIKEDCLLCEDCIREVEYEEESQP